MKQYIGVMGIGLAIAACNYDVGECYVRGEINGGAGGIIIVPTGAGGTGGFGDVPLEPLGAGDSYDADPCSTLAECTVTWKAGSDVCKSHKETGSCTTKYQTEASSLTEAKADCEHSYGVGKGGAESCGPCEWVTSTKDPVEQCKKLCDKINIDCIARCPKKDKECMNRCNQEHGKCLKDCEK